MGQTIAWCHQATSHYVSQCWPRSMSQYGISRQQWVKSILVIQGISEILTNIFSFNKMHLRISLQNGSHFVPVLTHWGRVMHICVGKLSIIGSDNGLLPGRRQAIIWTNAGILLIEPLGTNFSEILIGIKIFSLKKMRLKMSSAKWRPFCLGLNVLMY